VKQLRRDDNQDKVSGIMSEKQSPEDQPQVEVKHNKYQTYLDQHPKVKKYGMSVLLGIIALLVVVGIGIVVKHL